jgi:hypothetical protein
VRPSAALVAKALWRRACALERLGGPSRLERAVSDLIQLVRLSPGNTEAAVRARASPQRQP